MVISDKYKYLFVELPHTGSTAISRELCEYYDGTQILSKHIFYHQFLKTATPKRKNYFVFSCIRKPLVCVSDTKRITMEDIPIRQSGKEMGDLFPIIA